MHRFRKKSDAKQSQVPSSVRPQPLEVQGLLPELPSANDFRTSIILSDLTRQFTLLQTSSGAPLPFDILRNRFAEQRARGAEYQISEEEEDMILETLGRIRARNTGSADRSEGVQGKSDSPSVFSRQSTRSADTDASPTGSVTSSPGSRSGKRYSNNLFGSGRLRDYTYMLSQKSSSIRSATSFTPSSESSQSTKDDSNPNDLHGTPDDNISSVPQLNPVNIAEVQSVPYDDPFSLGVEPLTVNTISPAVLQRASIALEKAITQIEEEGEDEIVMPRSPPITRGAGIELSPSSSESTASPSDSHPYESSSTIEAGMAISSDKQVRMEPENHRVSPVPFRIAPGYIPGMPRPMTPRENLDLDDQRSLSTTPRATSPTFDSPIIPSSISGALRHENSTSGQSPRPISPSYTTAFLSRSPNGRFTPEDSSRVASFESDSPLNTLLGRRRPGSPLAGPPYQPWPMSSSRPGTPSNVTWTTPNNSLSQTGSGHSGNGSWLSEAAAATDANPNGSSERSTTLPLRSPPLQESPLIGRGASSMTNGCFLPEQRPLSPMSGFDLGSPTHPPKHGPRSPTPTQNIPRSPASPSFPSYDSSSVNGSRRSSKQHAPSSPLALGALNSLVFSPLANSSRSSFESTGSSYHSWEDDRLKDPTISLFSDLDPRQLAWHDFPSTDNSSSATPGASPDDDWDAEEIISRYAGLKKTDFLAIQEKLVDAARNKNVTVELRERAPSLRRRRPSTSQSNYSVNRDFRIASPPPHAQSPPAAVSTGIEQTANAPVNIANDNTEASFKQGTSKTTGRNDSQSDKDISPTTRRNRDLAHVLFGDEADGVDSKPQDATQSSPVTPSKPPPTDDPLLNHSSPQSLPAAAKSPQIVPISPIPYEQSRNPSTPKLIQSPQQEAELAREVQRKADAAMMALKKRPSQTNLAESSNLLSSGSISRKRISPNQISTPKLVSASTSVDTIPLRPASSDSGNYIGPSKISQRFKKFRGTLRSKPTPLGGEITPYPLDLESSPTSQTATYNPSKLDVGDKAVPASATDYGRSKVLVPSPPASAGPRFKGFMARFRSKQRIPDTLVESNKSVPASPQISLSLPLSSPQHTPTSPPANSLPPPVTATQGASPVNITPNQGRHSSDESTEAAAIQQLLSAADTLGLNQQIQDILRRSASTASKSAAWPQPKELTPNTHATVREEVTPANPPQVVQHVQGERPSMDSQRAELLKRAPGGRPDAVRRPRDEVDGVVRRTLIFPSDVPSAPDLNMLIRKSSSRRRRASAQSFTNRSVHDRVPTPPPPRSPTSRRFSTDTSPPVPQIPPSFSSQAEHLHPNIHAGGPIEKSSSTYDSLYEMYAGEVRVTGLTATDPNGTEHPQPTRSDMPVNPENGPALEVIELANGETIWSIVNGLRDEDVDSAYGNRTSFASEFSTRENGEGVQVFFKEHSRAGSKGSTSSFLSRTKYGKNRPETKVFYSSSAQIGRLIEDLSQRMDAGSFNFLPNRPAGHSNVSSLSDPDAHWTVEERLDHMLGSMGAH